MRKFPKTRKPAEGASEEAAESKSLEKSEDQPKGKKFGGKQAPPFKKKGALMPVPIPLRVNQRRVMPKHRTGPPPPDTTFEPTDPFKTYHEELSKGPPSHYGPETKKKWIEGMNKWFVANLGDKVT